MSVTAGSRGETSHRGDFPASFVPWRRALWGVFAVMLVLGLIGLTMRFVGGHLPAGYGSYVPWGLWIAIYFHGVGIAAGAFAVSALGYLFRREGLDTARSLRLACVLVVATVGPSLLAVGLDLGRMERAWRILVTPSFTSMMAFNTFTYLALLGVCALVWFLTYRPDRGWLRPLLVLGTLLIVMVPSQSGAFFGVVDAKPYWHSALLPILLFVSAMTAGAATLLFVRAVVGDVEGDPVRNETMSALRLLRIAVLVGLSVYFVLEFAEFSIALWNPQASSPELSLVLTGPYWWVFWLVHILLGGVVPFLLLLTRRPRVWVVASALIAVAFVSSRLNVLIPGQAVAELEGLQEAFVHPRLDYVYQATPMEYLVAFFCVALGMAIMYLGRRVSVALEPRLTGKGAADVDD
ncbi:MAG: NrfD/PsrC family molybdoenzyme membrane anchor subunit [Nitriliruptoraceae bacterium]